MPYDGVPEIKMRGEAKYLYVRKRIGGKLTSTYVGIYTDELYNLLLRNAGEIRQIRKEMRHIEKRLHELGYLVCYYEGEDIAVIRNFMKEKCRKTL